MAKIRNSSLNNFYGDGKQQIFKDNDGKEYIIRNSSLNNFYGDGKQQIVEERGNKSTIINACNPILILIMLLGLFGSFILPMIGYSSAGFFALIIGLISIAIDGILGFFK